MGRKSSYFRHSFNAHRDPKIMQLIERGGVKCVGVYFVILELYGTMLLDDDDQKISQNINVRLIANATGLRSDSCIKCVQLIAEVKLIRAVKYMSPCTYFQLDIPNFLKYYGKYEKTEQVKSPNKRKEKKSNTQKDDVKQNFDFESVYKAYPRKMGKAKGMMYCKIQIKTEKDFDDLKTAITNYANLMVSLNWAKQHILYFENFMECGKWRDYIEYQEENFPPPGVQGDAEHDAFVPISEQWTKEEQEQFDRLIDV